MAQEPHLNLLSTGIGLTLDQSEFVVSVMNGPMSMALLRFNARTLEPSPNGRFENSYRSGSHIVVHDAAVGTAPF